MKHWIRIFARVAALMPALVATAVCAAAQSTDPAPNYPNRPVRMITGSPGSTSDIAARFVARSTAAYRFVVSTLAWPSQWLIVTRSTPA